MSQQTDQGVRGTGRTTRQLLDAPQGSIYVWVTSDLRYPKMLCHKLGRTDLKICSLSVLQPFRLQGVRVPVVIDHACRLTYEEWDEFCLHRERM